MKNVQVRAIQEEIAGFLDAVVLDPKGEYYVNAEIKGF